MSYKIHGIILNLKLLDNVCSNVTSTISFKSNKVKVSSLKKKWTFEVELNKFDRTKDNGDQRTTSIVAIPRKKLHRITKFEVIKGTIIMT